MTAAFRLACLLALPLALGACGQEKPDEKARAGGEILPGSASDAMLPLDSLRSQPPAAPPSETRAAGKGDAEAAASDEPEAPATDAARAAASDPAPAASASALPPAE